MKVICIGSSAKDIFFPTSEGVVVNTPEDLESQKKFIFELGAKYHIDDRFESLGGCAANQACALSRLGISAFCYTAIGDDAVGEWIRKELIKEGIEENLIEVEANCISGLSAIVVDKKSGDRIIFSNQESNERFTVIPEKLKGADFISVTDLSGDWKGVLDEIIKTASENNIKIAFNPRGINIKEDSEKVSEIAGKAELLFVNKDEAVELLKNLNIETDGTEADLIRKIKNFGGKVVTITDGVRGAWAFNGEKIVYAKAMAEKALDTTGAGDAFSTGFMAAHFKGKNLEECIRWAITEAGSVVNYYGGIRGLLKEKDIMEGAANVNVQILN